jgi:hypothetical protein
MWTNNGSYLQSGSRLVVKIPQHMSLFMEADYANKPTTVQADRQCKHAPASCYLYDWQTSSTCACMLTHGSH